MLSLMEITKYVGILIITQNTHHVYILEYFLSFSIGTANHCALYRNYFCFFFIYTLFVFDCWEVIVKPQFFSEKDG